MELDRGITPNTHAIMRRFSVSCSGGAGNMKAPHVASLLRVAVPGALAATSALVWNGVASPRTFVQAAPPIQFGTPTVVCWSIRSTGTSNMWVMR